MKNRNRKLWSALCVTALLLCGCGGGAASGDRPGYAEGAGCSETGAMGRYMETVYELPQEMNRNGGLNWLSDGSLSVIDFACGLFRSMDGGQTWQQEDTVWFPMLQDVYCLAAAMGPDGTVAASCIGEMPEAAREAYGMPLAEDWEGNYCVFGMPDGTVKVVDFGFSQEEGSGISSFVFKEDGRLFAGDMSGRVYEVHVENASLKELFMAERAVGYMDFSGSVLMAVGYDRLYQYDLSREALLPQDETADAFLRQKLSDGTVSYTGGGYPLIVFGGEDEHTVYIACQDGLYRHARDGSVMEQVIDGALCTLGDASATLYKGKMLENQEFLIQYNVSAGLVRYIYDEEIPSMPDKEIRIYSLKENPEVRQAMTAWKKERTDLYVRYEVGVDEESGITEEDAIRKLNTQILAGEGPDVLILDGLPLDTYVEKGLLRDLSGLLGEMEEEDLLFSNLTEGFADGTGAVYAAPMCVRVPLLAGDRETLDRISDLAGAGEAPGQMADEGETGEASGQTADLAGFAEEMEQLRAEEPSGGLLGIYDPETLLRLFGMVSSPAWTDESGGIDEDAVAEFLYQVSRIYDAEQSGAVPEEVEALAKESEELIQYGIDPVELALQTNENVLNISRGYARLACGYVDGIQLSLDCVTSVAREEGLDYQVFAGQAGKVYIPEGLVGVSARTEQPEEAENFVRNMFSEKTQENMGSGFPVNRAAFEEEFLFLEENESNGSMILQNSDGTESELALYWPTDAERETFTGYVESLDTPAPPDSWLAELVYETGVRVLDKELSVEEGTEDIVKKAAIYLAE